MNINNSPLLVGISGRIAAGKDYLADRLTEEFTSRGIRTARASYGAALKTELDVILELLRTSKNPEKTIEEQLSIPAHQVQTLIDTLTPDLGVEGLNAYSRTLGVRTALQYLGTDIRRAQDENYWVNQFNHTVAQMNTALNAGQEPVDIVFATDVRFVNEADNTVTRGVGIRIDVPNSVLEQRRTARDGIVYTPEQLNHASETALEGYTEWDIVLGASYDVSFVANLILESATLKQLQL